LSHPDVNIANEVEVIRGVKRGFSGVSISPDNQLMLTLGNEQVDIWDLDTRKKITSLSTPYTDHSSF
jgi:WD40 repeat protein